jgi:hypothetical protein
MVPINASDWIYNYEIWWEEGQVELGPGEYRMKIMDGGMLLFGTNEDAKEGDEEFIVVAPDTWTRIKTGTVDPTK